MAAKFYLFIFFTLWVRMKTNCHGIISSSLSQPAGPKTGTLPSCNMENIEFLCILRERRSHIHIGVSVLPSGFSMTDVAMSFVLPGHWCHWHLLLKGTLMKLRKWATKPWSSHHRPTQPHLGSYWCQRSSPIPNVCKVPWHHNFKRMDNITV